MFATCKSVVKAMRISRLRVLLYFTFVQTIVLYSLVYVCEETWQYWGRLLLVDDKIRSGHLEHLSDKVPRKAIIRPVITRYRLSYCWNDRHEFSHLRVSSLLPIIPYVIIEDFWFLKTGHVTLGSFFFSIIIIFLQGCIALPCSFALKRMLFIHVSHCPLLHVIISSCVLYLCSSNTLVDPAKLTSKSRIQN